MNKNEWIEFYQSNFNEFWKGIRLYFVFDDEVSEEDVIRETLHDFAVNGGYNTIEMIKTWIGNGVELKSNIPHMYDNLALLCMAKTLAKEFEK